MAANDPAELNPATSPVVEVDSIKDLPKIISGVAANLGEIEKIIIGVAKEIALFLSETGKIDKMDAGQITKSEERLREIQSRIMEPTKLLVSTRGALDRGISITKDFEAAASQKGLEVAAPS